MPWDNRVKKQTAIDAVNAAYAYESPFPDYDALATNPNIKARCSFNGIDKLQLGIDRLDLTELQTIFHKYEPEWTPSDTDEATAFTKNPKFNLSYPELDAFILYAFVRHYKPKNIIEIGSGQSTRVMIQACKRNANACQITCIEPYTDITPLAVSYPLRIIKDKLENVDINLFASLGANDILFIDSSHVLRPYGDVEYEYLHILPMLNPGCIVHIHDIFYPFDYPDLWIIDWRVALTEQQLLISFLYGNIHWQTFCANNYISHCKQELVPKKIQYRHGASYWIQKLN